MSIFDDPLFPFMVVFFACFVVALMIWKMGLQRFVDLAKTQKKNIHLDFYPANDTIDSFINMRFMKNLSFDGISGPFGVKHTEDGTPKLSFWIKGRDKELDMPWAEPADFSQVRAANLEAILMRNGAAWDIVSEAKEDRQNELIRNKNIEMNYMRHEDAQLRQDNDSRMLQAGKVWDQIFKYAGKNLVSWESAKEKKGEGTTINVGEKVPAESEGTEVK